jgi:hypothetical protein
VLLFLALSLQITPIVLSCFTKSGYTLPENNGLHSSKHELVIVLLVEHLKSFQVTQVLPFAASKAKILAVNTPKAETPLLIAAAKTLSESASPERIQPMPLPLSLP